MNVGQDLLTELVKCVWIGGNQAIAVNMDTHAERGLAYQTKFLLLWTGNNLEQTAKYSMLNS